MAKCRHNGPTSAQLGKPLQNCANISQKCRISEKLGNYSTFNMGIFLHHLPATERCSDILDKITYIPERDDSVIPFYKILNDTHYDTASYRRKDNKDFCFLSDYRKRLSRSKNFKMKQNTSKISRQIRQLLIENAFKKITT